MHYLLAIWDGGGAVPPQLSLVRGLVDRGHTATVLADPTLDPVTGESSLLEDGTHQTGSTHGQRPGPGVDTWIDLVVDKWERVNR